MSLDVNDIVRQPMNEPESRSMSSDFNVDPSTTRILPPLPGHDFFAFGAVLSSPERRFSRSR